MAHPLVAVLAVPLWLVASAAPAGKEVAPLENAHAHNDYHHERPLVDALSHGFTSVEADVFLVEHRKLLVGHSRDELRPDRTLAALYLEPLRERTRANGGRVYRGGPEFTLLVDIKSSAEPTYDALARELAAFADILTAVRDGKLEQKAVRVVISGNRAWERIARDSLRYCGVDGRFSDLASEKPAHLMPLVSDNWGLHFAWRGEGPMPAVERARLREAVRKAHASGRRLRLWATPERRSVWEELQAAGVDLINTDDLAGLQAFLLEQAARDGKPSAR